VYDRSFPDFERSHHRGHGESVTDGEQAQPHEIQTLGAALDPVYQVLEFAEPFNFRSRNPRVPAPPAKSV
jgi:hypothetical protein